MFVYRCIKTHLHVYLYTYVHIYAYMRVYVYILYTLPWIYYDLFIYELHVHAYICIFVSE
jgi:hypothetical protein